MHMKHVRRYSVCMCACKGDINTVIPTLIIRHSTYMNALNNNIPERIVLQTPGRPGTTTTTTTSGAGGAGGAGGK